MPRLLHQWEGFRLVKDGLYRILEKTNLDALGNQAWFQIRRWKIDDLISGDDLVERELLRAVDDLTAKLPRTDAAT